MAVEASAIEVVRRFYDAVAARDLAAARACFAEDAVWVLPGRSPIAGEHRGWNAIHDDFLGKLGPLSGWSLGVELVDVAVGAKQLVAVQHATGTRNGKRLDVTGCQLMRVEDGRIVDVRGHYSDQYAFDEFWS